MDAEPEADPGSTQLRRSWQHAAAQAVAAVDALAAWRPSRSTPATDRWLWPAAQCGGESVTEAPHPIHSAAYADPLSRSECFLAS